MVTQSGHGQSLAVVVDGAAAERARPVLRGARSRISSPRRGGAACRRASPVALVSLVAEAMGQWPNVAGRFFGALGNVGINVRAIAQGASSREHRLRGGRQPTPPRPCAPSTPPSTSPRPR